MAATERQLDTFEASDLPALDEAAALGRRWARHLERLEERSGGRVLHIRVQRR